MIDHVSIPVRDYKKSLVFYEKALQPLGYTLEKEYPPDSAGFKEGIFPSVWIVVKKKKTDPIHVAFRAKSKSEVQEFHAKGVDAGGKNNGKPGFRTDYGPNYYAAYILDLDGNNLEACYFGEDESGLE